MTLPLIAAGMLCLATGVLVMVAARLIRALRQTGELEQRIARLQEGVNLLTDTIETGFRQVAAEVERLSTHGPAGSPVVASRPTAVRLRAATRRGRTITEIAAAEHVSEGEVRLRLSIADAGAKGRSRGGREKADAALRA